MSAKSHNTSLPNRSKKRTSDGKTVSYAAEKVIDNGSFGVVFMAKVLETDEVVAIKKVLQDKRFKNRELQIMRLLKHPNIVDLKHCFYSNGEKSDELYLNLVLEYVPMTIYKLGRAFRKRANKSERAIPLIQIKLYMYQLCRALGYTHARGVCHRDIKPQNLLVDPKLHILKLCDFGSAKVLVEGEPNVSYICSRYYRAPELIFGATKYTVAIDLWSMGCVCAEMMLGRPLFPGESGVDQLVEIIKVLGTPSSDQIRSMNRHYTDFKFPSIKAKTWGSVFQSQTLSEEAISFVESLLKYEPQYRTPALQSLLHPFFDELREPSVGAALGVPLPPLFNFTDTEFKSYDTLDWNKLIPKHARNASNWPPRTKQKSEDTDKDGMKCAAVAASSASKNSDRLEGSESASKSSEKAGTAGSAEESEGVSKGAAASAK